MSEWITDRLPTAEDADFQGDVRFRRNPDCEPESAPHIHYTCVVPGQPWWSGRAARAAQPTQPPAPAPARVVTALAIDSDDVIIAACDDGTLWAWNLGEQWRQLLSIPQPEASNA